MIGLSFRLNMTATDCIDSTYGISFFRSIGRGDVHKPGWIDDLDSAFDHTMANGDGDRYIVLREKLAGTGTYSLLASELLNDESDLKL